MERDVVTFTTSDPTLSKLLASVERIAAFPTTVSITGESGTGKELLARLIHDKSPRKDKPFVAVNCGAIPENLVESELFGYLQGAFTDATHDKTGLIELANGGTLFLDEIAEIPLALQAKLLRVLQERKIRRIGANTEQTVDVRILAASWKDLESEVKAKRFREDFYFRLNVVTLHIPALRERPSDILTLTTEIVTRINKRLGTSVISVSKKAQDLLLAYHWPGNVRELENCLERALVLCEGNEITEQDLPEGLGTKTTKATNPQLELLNPDDLSIPNAVRNIEENFIKRALEKTNGNRTHAAKILEISHRALLYKIKEYNLS